MAVPGVRDAGARRSEIVTRETIKCARGCDTGIPTTATAATELLVTADDACPLRWQTAENGDMKSAL